MTEKILTSLNIKLPARELKYTDVKGPLQALFLNWMPLGRNLLDMIVEMLPSPTQLGALKVEQLMCSKMKPFKSLPIQTQQLKEDFLNCSSDESRPVIVFISKMFAVEIENINKRLVDLVFFFHKQRYVCLNLIAFKSF
jgi:ribosome assembly protein 1